MWASPFLSTWTCRQVHYSYTDASVGVDGLQLSSLKLQCEYKSVIFLQVVRLYRALIVLGLALYLHGDIYIFFKNFAYILLFTF